MRTGLGHAAGLFSGKNRAHPDDDPLILGKARDDGFDQAFDREFRAFASRGPW
ncbi:hypothetical protein [Breoghania sp.]|uniref:hypothetical protein n=1 Tax=Breoghania sp. TaxID=2065378 RepID=UPI00261EC683|nr:hypothetical protein [Breoghania sp.]MDJ0933476.1 hypothetical protein [Breoghania sp.]